jgi:integrase
MRRQQKGYVFRKGKSWFVRYLDDVLQADNSIERKLVCKKLDVEYGGEFRTKSSVQPFVVDVLRPINRGLSDVRSTSSIAKFVEDTYFPQYADERLRASTRKTYLDTWNVHIKNRLGGMTLREFRTVDGEQLLAKIARDTELGKNSLKHVKSFLSGIFKQAKRLGILDGVNPMQDVSLPRTKEAGETYAYTLREITGMLALLPEPARTVVHTAALTGLRKGEIRGLQWSDFNGKELTVRRSIWNGFTNEPKTNRSKAPVPVIRELAEALEEHRLRMGKLAAGPIFQAGNGKPMNLDNLRRRVIIPSIEHCLVCGKRRAKHRKEKHPFKLDESIQWHGWHAFRRGLATNLHTLRVDDKTIQAILRHSNVGITQNIYIKHVAESGVNAMDLLGAELQKNRINNDVATKRAHLLN